MHRVEEILESLHKFLDRTARLRPPVSLVSHCLAWSRRSHDSFWDKRHRQQNLPLGPCWSVGDLDHCRAKLLVSVLVAAAKD